MFMQLYIFIWTNNLLEKKSENGKVLMKDSLYEDNSRLGFIKAVHQWKWKNATPYRMSRILFSNVYNIWCTIRRDQNDMST